MEDTDLLSQLKEKYLQSKPIGKVEVEPPPKKEEDPYEKAEGDEDIESQFLFDKLSTLEGELSMYLTILKNKLSRR